MFYIFFAPQLAFMMERLMYAVNAQMEAAEAVNKLEAILKESPFPEPAADSGSKPADSSISFENVTFSYDGADRPALTNVSFHLPQGGGVGVGGPLRRRQDYCFPAGGTVLGLPEGASSPWAAWRFPESTRKSS